MAAARVPIHVVAQTPLRIAEKYFMLVSWLRNSLQQPATQNNNGTDQIFPSC
jgi:hypothetical protein